MTEVKKQKLSDKKLLQFLMNSVQDFVYVKDKENQYFKASDSFARNLGIEKNNIIGKRDSDLFSKDQAEKIEQEDMQVMKEEISVKNEEKEINWPEREGWVEATKVPLYDDDEVVGMFAYLRDISDRKELEMELRESEERYRKTIENANIGVGVYGADKKIKVLNPAMKEIIGYDKEDTPTLGQWFKKLYPNHEKRMEISRLWFEEIAKEGQISGIETDIESKDGKTRTLLFNAVQLRSGNVIFFAEDITELVEAREELEQRKEELEKKTEELEAFVYTVSHDLRTPLISLEGFSDMLCEEFEEDLGEEGIHYLDRIRANVQKMDDFIDDLLELSRVGRKKTKKEQVDLKSVVDEILDDLSTRIEERGIEVEVDETMPTMYFERKRLYQIFSNFVSNACKYIGDQENPKIKIGAEDKGSSWLFWVEDNGMGIEPENQEKIFEIFHREERSDEKGTGVGLAIVKRIVENHGGEIWVESEVGEGTTFYVKIPQ